MTDLGKYRRTDLACESALFAPERGRVREYSRRGVRFAKMTVERADESLAGRRAGTYVTVYSGKIPSPGDESAENIACAVGEELADFLGRACGGPVRRTVLVCGLGNRSVTPDALGPHSVDLMTVTRHLEGGNFARLCAVCPGTLGQTGIEAAEQLSAAVREISPDAVIAVDALASRSVERLAATVQISDSGICPGSGVGNARREISRETLGVPVIAVGVPTVVDSCTLVADALEAAGYGELGDEVLAVLDAGRNMFVAPRECDEISENAAAMICAAIEKACLIRN